ncbi:SpoIIIAH-like family protein [Cytobacillus oceanisediminis]|uniref:SpoIIIAH-like family protein n=1 Tax=Niallia alba TaxID=2729105 RepID=A0A7Y0K9Z0_9BACI|nr:MULTISPECIES: SpoIIIAH-like family protein [Bacillaceae]MBQ6447414.1 SpoIIIAH-like family protein [Bacillus sp. (in: firmicutes)]MBZ9533490.1 SpoIIIAH-like family protein [Cytobacillus oceanisediminis]NMO78400.1 SpoIIIAH-like family protein [Niallia alba]UTI41673.1 SpoIIIAH-like family protein [Niallia sp. RD1]
MLLKKQTVWLLTMLSLVVVLSVYYITSPESRLNEFATTEEDNAKTNDAKETATDSKGESTVTTTDSEAVFEQMRLDLMEQRDKMKEELVTVQGSKDKTAEEKNEATEKIKELQAITDNEKIMESLIKAENYEDVLVQTSDDGTVKVTVKAEELSAEAANEIVQLIRKNMDSPNANVAVKIDPK